MFDEFDKYISEFAMEDFAVDYWYDEGVDIAEAMLHEFDDSDLLPERTVEWQKRLAYCMNNESDLNQLIVLLRLADTDNNELFEITVDSLRGFTSEERLNLIQNHPQIIFKIKQLLPKVGNATERVFEEITNTFKLGENNYVPISEEQTD